MLPNDPFSMIAVIVMAGCLAGLGGRVAHYGYLAWKSSQESALKRDMVARGYTAREIIEVIAAEPGSQCNAVLPDVPPAKPVKQMA